METKIIAYVLIGIFLGPVASLAITPIFCLLRKLFYVPFIRESLREKAERKGHVVELWKIWEHTVTRLMVEHINIVFCRLLEYRKL